MSSTVNVEDVDDVNVVSSSSDVFIQNDAIFVDDFFINSPPEATTRVDLCRVTADADVDTDVADKEKALLLLLLFFQQTPLFLFSETFEPRLLGCFGERT